MMQENKMKSVADILYLYLGSKIELVENEFCSLSTVCHNVL